ncbi:MAG: NAD(+) synthase [Lentisphaerae bacterium]|nr:NAD(+) synthase [Lentisphaerota bacterium]
MPESLRTRLAQIEVHPGDPARNTARMLECIESASRDKVELIVFPEMAVPGYLIGDEWERGSFLRECEACADEIRAAAGRMLVVFGTVATDPSRLNEDGRVRKYNALYVAHDGTFLHPASGPYDFVVKSLLPNYREFDDSRHFYDLRKLAAEEKVPFSELVSPVIAPSGLSLGCMLCEDAWDTDYASKPLEALCARRAHILINCSASPFTLSKNNKRGRVFSAHAERHRRPFLYVNNVGIQNNGKTIFTFDGSSCAYDGQGHSMAAGRMFEETFPTFDMPIDGRPFGDPLDLRTDGVAEAAQAVIYGTDRFMKSCGVRKVAVGVSGGVDSAVVAALYSRLLKPEDLLLVNMPGPFTSQTTIGLARRLAANLGCLYTEIPIGDGVELTRRQIGAVTAASADGVLTRTLDLTPFMFENVQARDRISRVLSATAAAFGGVFTCNANKSELTVGYTTMYGDLGGYLANIGDLWKTDVYELAQHINANLFGREVIPAGTIGLTPSAELSEAQNVDMKKGDPLLYPYHDSLFRSWVEWWNRASPEEILAWQAEGTLKEKLSLPRQITRFFPTPEAFVEDLERWWNQYRGMGVAKRIQAPPILAVTRRAFGFDHRESQMGVTYTRKYEALKKKLLSGQTKWFRAR